METTHSRADVRCGVRRTYVKGDAFMVDEKLLAELYAQPKKPHHLKKIPNETAIQAMRDLWHKVTRDELAKALGVTSKTMLGWYREYIEGGSK